MDGKEVTIQKDRTKTKSSYRTLPLVPPFEELLHRLRQEQLINQKVCGAAYCQKYLDYIYVNAMGELVKPNFITQHFEITLKNNGLKNPFSRPPSQLCQPALRKWRQLEGNPGMAGAQ